MTTPQTLTPAALRHVENEIPTGPIDGVNVLYHTQYIFFDPTIRVYLNGLLQHQGPSAQYVVGANHKSIIMNDAPLPGDQLVVGYFRKI